MKRIFELSKQYNFKIIEDASHAIGARYKNSLVGNCQYSDITVFSFHPVKIITTAEGGIALTNQTALANKMSRLRSHGITTDKGLFEFRQGNEIWNYQQTELGFNYRMNELQAALGISQLKKINIFIKKRRKIVERYNSYLKELPLVLPWQHPDSESSFHLYPMVLPHQNRGIDQKRLFLHLKSVGINVNIHYIPIHRQPYFEKLGFQEGSFPQSEKFFKSVISLPIYPDLKKNQQMFVINKIKQVFAL